MPNALIDAQNIVKDFKVSRGMFKRKQSLRAIDGVSLRINRGEVLGLVGESGCGKTTLARSVLGILPKNSAVISSGTILFEDTDLLKIPEKSLANSFRGRTVTFIPQDPFSSFNPFFTIGSQMMELMKWKSPMWRLWKTTCLMPPSRATSPNRWCLSPTKNQVLFNVGDEPLDRERWTTGSCWVNGRSVCSL